ncbi:hypothetical protein [Sulfurimonas sp. HSL3-7]|uniref:hypothetical protein n=1 Tax=Sulfonitrofixus jiaomeiensis TaxID=3131938 RepID=UPI0031F87B24
MKVIIDLIEDIRTAINNDSSFSLLAMGLKEEESGEFSPSWESPICSMKIDDEKNRLFLFLGKGKALGVGQFLTVLHALPNAAMMYEVCVSYSKERERVDSSLMGFGESVRDKKYLLFVPA